MASPTLEPYREEIRERLHQRQTKAEIKRALEQKHRLTIGHSQFYAFVNEVSRDVSPPAKEESFMPLHEVKASESVLDDETVRAFFVELPRALQEVSEKIDALDRKTSEQKQTMVQALREFHATLSGMTKQVQERSVPIPSGTTSGVSVKQAAPFPSSVHSATLRQIWKRAFLVSGITYVLIDALLVRGYWRPLWAAVAKWI